MRIASCGRNAPSGTVSCPVSLRVSVARTAAASGNVTEWCRYRKQRRFVGTDQVSPALTSVYWSGRGGQDETEKRLSRQDVAFLPFYASCVHDEPASRWAYSTVDVVYHRCGWRYRLIFCKTRVLAHVYTTF